MSSPTSIQETTESTPFYNGFRNELFRKKSHKEKNSAASLKRKVSSSIHVLANTALKPIIESVEGHKQILLAFKASFYQEANVALMTKGGK